MPFWSNYVNTNPEVDDDDLPLPQHRLIDDYGNQKACVTPEESQLLTSIKKSYFVRALSRRSRSPQHQHHAYQYRHHHLHHHQPTHSGKHYAKKSSPFSSKRRAEIVSVIKETLTSPFKYMADHGRRSLSSISSMSISPFAHSHSRSRSSSLTHHTKHTHNSRKTTRSTNAKKRARSPVHHSSKTKSARSRSSSSVSAASSSSVERLSTSPVSHVNLSPIPPHTQTSHHQPHQMTSSPQPKKPEQAVTPPASKRTRHSSNQAERSHSSNSGSRKITSKHSHSSSTPCNQWSVSSLRKYAKQHSIPITGLRNKTDIVNAITCATLHPEK